MSHTGGRITSTVGIVADLQAVLGTSENRVSYLCTHSNIKRLAKYKPVDYDTQGQRITNAQRAAANYGIVDIPVWDRLSYMRDFLFGDKLTPLYYPSCGLKIEYFTYRRPQGGSSSPYRLADFINYDHDVPSDFIFSMQSSSISIGADGNLQISFPKGFVNDYVLRYSDLLYDGQHSIGSMYYGIIMKKDSTTVVATQSASISTLDSGGTENFVIRINTGSLSTVSWTGTWYIYPIASSQSISATASISSYEIGTYICLLPYHNQPITIDVQYAEIEITSHHGYKDRISQQRYARFDFSLSNSEPSGLTRNYRIDLEICDSTGTQIWGYSGATTGQIQTGQIGDAHISVYIAAHWSDAMYYRATLSITDSLVYKRTSVVRLTGPILVEDPSPTPV